MHAFIISMPEDSPRRRSALEKIKPVGIPFEIVDGVEAKKWLPEELRRVCTSRCSLKPGEIGCYLAHLRAMKRVVEYGLPWAIILEDDFCFEANPDFGLAQIEPYLTFDFDYIQLQRDLGWTPWLQTRDHSRYFLQMNGTPLGTTGYLISNRFCQEMLTKHSVVNVQIDQQFCQVGRHYCFLRPRKPIIGIQVGLHSDINGW
jgi:glycosyl transferase, family 25